MATVRGGIILFRCAVLDWCACSDGWLSTHVHMGSNNLALWTVKRSKGHELGKACVCRTWRGSQWQIYQNILYICMTFLKQLSNKSNHKEYTSFTSAKLELDCS